MPISQKQPSAFDEYIARYPKDIRNILSRIRSIVRRAAPKAEEAVSYGIPTFKLNGNLVHFAAFKNHIGFYPTPKGISDFKKELKPYEQAKGSIRFPLNEPIPYGLIRKITVARVKENEAKAERGRTGQAQPPRRPRQPMPDLIRQALLDKGLMPAFLARPPYQQNDYIGWVNRAVQKSTKEKRIGQMISELKKGDVYMKMEYKPKTKKEDKNGKKS